MGLARVEFAGLGSTGTDSNGWGGLGFAVLGLARLGWALLGSAVVAYYYITGFYKFFRVFSTKNLVITMVKALENS